MNLKKRLIVVVGPTASGKSEFAVKLAKKVGGEIISADSRQVYRGLNIGSGKVEGNWEEGKFVYKGIPHYLIDVASPLRQFSVARFQREAKKIIDDILAREKTPIICGGTGHWVDAVTLGQILPEVKPDIKLRKKLEKLSSDQMFAKLQKLDPERAAKIDAKNPRRLIRALEIILTTGKPVPKVKAQGIYDVRWTGLKPSAEALENNIKKRLNARFKQGMIDEVNELRKNGLSWKKLESFGLEYKYCALFLQNKISKAEMETQLYTAIRQYAKRQMTWWKRNPNIKWQAP